MKFGAPIAVLHGLADRNLTDVRGM
jgi:hypothetical protein